jgi:hypothetical protein
MTPPTVLIELSIEARPKVRLIAGTEGEEQRLRQWLETSGYWARLVDLAMEIAGQ